MNVNFDDISVDIECPECQQSFEIILSDVGNTVTCPHCKQIIKLVDAGLSDSLSNVENQLNELFNNF